MFVRVNFSSFSNLNAMSYLFFCVCNRIFRIKRPPFTFLQCGRMMHAHDLRERTPGHLSFPQLPSLKGRSLVLRLILIAALAGSHHARFGVPSDRLLNIFLEVRVHWLPAELGLRLGRIGRITAVVARTVLHSVEIVGILAQHGQDVAQHGQVIAFAVRADQIRFIRLPLTKIIHMAEL